MQPARAAAAPLLLLLFLLLLLLVVPDVASSGNFFVPSSVVSFCSILRPLLRSELDRSAGDI
jgi:hypothetical protein